LVVRAEGELLVEAGTDLRDILARDGPWVGPLLRDLDGHEPGLLALPAGSLVPAISQDSLLALRSVLRPSALAAVGACASPEPGRPQPAEAKRGWPREQHAL